MVKLSVIFSDRLLKKGHVFETKKDDKSEILEILLYDKTRKDDPLLLFNGLKKRKISSMRKC